MAFYVNITKISELNDQKALYQVKSFDYFFFIEIDINNKKVELKKNDNTDVPCVIDFNEIDKEIKVDWLSGKLIHIVIMKARQVIVSKTFFDDISFYA